ncbi:acyl-CoA thioesterase [Oceanobacillus piezotolerans]|uniref:Acyl-CoA thioesterase n=1 Tax=Oceanobacillus piezotolerans TaxID=2448030 RepID=A0A498DBC5_9BACI|nr:acyl-CoA thioesterase [Oceanobacillus piezotolerans]RLL46868.1 acyl-CoA thioesterase [Oceanobacillus piezotolerans]
MNGHYTEITVQPDDIDSLNHMNNIVYIQYLEKARFEWYDQIGLSLETLMSKGQALVLRNLEVSYINEARLGDTLKIKTSPFKRGKTSYTLKQIIYNQKNEILTEAETVTVMIDLEKRKSIPLIADITKYFE